MVEPQRLYATDFLAWTREQAEALRGAARVAPRSGTFPGLDWNNLAEEIESLGGSQHTALSSQIRRILIHLLKLEFSPAEAPRKGWRQSIRDARDLAEDVLVTNPSLKPELSTIVADQARRALRSAQAEMEDYGEADRATRARMEIRTYDPETEVLSDWLPPLDPPR